MDCKKALEIVLVLCIVITQWSCSSDNKVVNQKFNSISFNVNDGINPIEKATVKLLSEKKTDVNGNTVFNNLLAGKYNYTISKVGYDKIDGNITIVNDDIVKNTSLMKEEVFDGEIKIMSYNIHWGKNSNNVIDIDGISDVINEAKPDIVLLQEVDILTTRSNNIDEVSELSRLTNMSGYFGKQYDQEGGEVGVAILSKFLVIETENIQYNYQPDPSEKTRTSLWATIVIEKDTIIVGCTHLRSGSTSAVSQSMREEQAEQIVSLIKGQNYPVLFGGDLNETPSGPAIQQFENISVMSDKEPYTFTWPAITPEKKIDYIMMYPYSDWELKKYEVIPEKYASDHRPVMSKVLLNIE